MKNKKLSLIVIAFTSLGLVACGGDKTTSSAQPTSSVEQTSVIDSSETPASSEAPASSSVAPESSSKEDEYPAVKVAFKNAPDYIERGSSATIRVTVSTDADDKTVNFSVEQDDTYITLPENTEGVISISVTGKRIGTATIIATSVANPNVSARLTVEVVAKKQALQNVWKNVIANTNYTLTSYQPDPDDEDLSIEYVTTKVTSKAITATANILDDDTGNYETKDLYMVQDDLGNTLNVKGIGLDQNGYGFYIYTNEAGEYQTPGTAITTDAGLLTSTNMAGLGSSATSPNDVGLYFGLSSINPSWLTKTKSSDNTYDIEGTEEDQNSAFVEVLVWGLLDPVGRESYLESQSGSVYYYTLAEQVETVITVVDNNTVSLSCTYDDVTYTGYISDIGTTTQDADLETFLASETCVATLPELPAEITALKNAIDENNFVQHNATYPDGATKVTYETYFTEDYVFEYYSPEFIAQYETLSGKSWSASADGSGVFKGADGLYAFTYDDAETDDEGNVTTQAQVTIGQKYTGYDATSYLPDEYGYLSTMDMFNSGSALYTFSDSEEQIFSGMSAYYYSQNLDCFGELLSYYYGSYASSVSYSYAITGFAVDSDYDSVTKLYTVNSCEVLLAFSTDGSGYSLTGFELDNFGNAEAVNPADALIQEAIASTEAE